MDKYAAVDLDTPPQRNSPLARPVSWKPDKKLKHYRNKLGAHIHPFPLIYLVKRSGNIGAHSLT